MDENKVAKRSDFHIVPEEFMKSVALFQSRINSEPLKADIEINALANNSLYLPIGVIERKLDELFSGLYSISCLDVKQIINELVVTARIEYFHPIAGVWMHRDGVGGAQIRWRKDVPITNMDGKQKNALVADAPHAYAEAIKNAAKKIGNSFGRNLNRDDDYSRYVEVGEFLSEFDEMVQENIQKELEACKTLDDFSKLWNDNKNLQEIIAFKTMFLKERKKKGV